jgi:hypothetical protein
MGWDGWVVGWDETLILIFDVILHALRMQTTAKLLGSPDPLLFSFPLKLNGADHGLHKYDSVQIS